MKNDSQNADLTTRENRTAVLSTAAVLAVFPVALQALKMLAITLQATSFTGLPICIGGSSLQCLFLCKSTVLYIVSVVNVS